MKQKGLTLIELLAVLIIERTKKVATETNVNTYVSYTTGNKILYNPKTGEYCDNVAGVEIIKME